MYFLSKCNFCDFVTFLFFTKNSSNRYWLILVTYDLDRSNKYKFNYFLVRLPNPCWSTFIILPFKWSNNLMWLFFDKRLGRPLLHLKGKIMKAWIKKSYQEIIENCVFFYQSKSYVMI